MERRTGHSPETSKDIESILQRELDRAQGRIDKATTVLIQRENNVLHFLHIDTIFPQKDLEAAPAITGDYEEAPNSHLNQEVARAGEVIAVINRIAKEAGIELRQEEPK